MACGATLKRHHEFDPLSPLHSSPGCSPKRMCLSIDVISPASQTKRHHLPTNSAFVEAAQKFKNDQFAVRMSPSSSKLSSASSSMLSSSSFSKLNSTALPTSQSNVWSSGSESRAFVSASYEAPLVKKEKEAPLFTLKQVNTICKNMVTEHEHRVRQEYDKVLNNKLAEQYENFLKFNHDQLHKRFGNSTASYVS
jgi:hypothetical protein